MNTPNLAPLVSRIEDILAIITRISETLSQAGGDSKKVQRAYKIAHNFQLALAAKWLASNGKLLARNARFVKMATGEQWPASQVGAMGSHFERSLGDYNEETTNVVGNEQTQVIEYTARVKQGGAFAIGEDSLRPPKPSFHVHIANVLTIRDGRVEQVEQYTDTYGILRQLGLMKDISLGHDEAKLPHARHEEHARPAVKTPELIEVLRDGPFAGGGVSLGTGSSKIAKTNMENCGQIHLAFINRKPEMFTDLIADGSVWIDVPTHQVLEGAVAAAVHDHSNWSVAFTDSTATIEKVSSNHEWSIVQHQGTGTHLGELRLGGAVFKPTGKRISINVLDMVKLKAGKAVLIRNYYDCGQLLRQLGLADTFLI